MQNELRETVDHTDFATRSKLLAEEIAVTRPDLIGLRRSRCGDVDPCSSTKSADRTRRWSTMTSWASC